MFSLFISFDTLISNLNQIFFLFFFIFLFLFYYNIFFFINSNLFNSIINFLFLEIRLASKLKSNFNLFVSMSLFLLILALNLLGMTPFSYTMTSQLNFCFFLSLIFWMSIMIMNLFHKINYFLSHLVPSGSPLILSQFMVLIESISQFIRPLTLGVRLMANMTAGHLIMILCSGSFFFLSLISFPLFLLIFLEYMVALIQSYVFVVLLSMYLGEFNN